MRHHVELWLRRTYLWLPAVLVVALGLTLLFAYRLAISVRISTLDQSVAQDTQRLEEIRREREELEEALLRARTTADLIDYMEEDRFGTEAERLTHTMALVRRLAQTAGLRGMETFSYPEEPVPELGLVQKSFVFSAQGTYSQLRELINLLELTETFLVLEEIRVTGREAGQLTLQLRLSTVFVDERARGEA
jgi:hypothetical protein